MNSRTNRLLLVAGVALSALSGLAAAQSQPAGTPLSGPQAPIRDTPGGGAGFNGTPAPIAKKDRGAPVRGWASVQVIRETLGDNAPAEIRLSAEQKTKIDAVVADLRQQMQDFAKQHKGDVAALRSRGAKSTIDGENAGQQAVASKLKELREKAPSSNDALTKIWALLSDAQKQAVQPKLDDLRQQGARAEGEAFAKRKTDRAGDKRADKSQIKTGDKAAAAGAQGDTSKLQSLLDRLPPEKRDQVKQRLENMSPEDRQKLIERIQQRRAAGPKPVGSGNGLRQRAGSPNRTPAPAPAPTPAPDAQPSNTPAPATTPPGQ